MSKYPTNGWLISTDAHKYLQISNIPTDSYRYLKNTGRHLKMPVDDTGRYLKTPADILKKYPQISEDGL